MKKNNMSKAKTGKKLIITGVIFVLSALSIYIHNQVMDNNARSFTDKVMYNIDEYIHHQKRRAIQNRCKSVPAVLLQRPSARSNYPRTKRQNR